MSPSAAYYEWLAVGEPYAPARPIREFVDLLRANGYTVYHKGDTSHMQASRPEDHTPFSATGWPWQSARWVGHALDIMPGGGPLGLVTLGERIIADRKANIAGAMWIKYVNWTDSAGATWHESWQPSHARVASTDKGHIHISATSNMDASDIVSRTGYNPLQGGIVTALDSTNADFQALVWRMYAIIGNHDTVGGSTVKGENNALKDALTALQADLSRLLARPATVAITPEGLASALVGALAADPTVVDALATAVASRVGMIPTAHEIAKAIGELDWHGSVQA